MVSVLLLCLLRDNLDYLFSSKRDNIVYLHRLVKNMYSTEYIHTIVCDCVLTEARTFTQTNATTVDTFTFVFNEGSRLSLSSSVTNIQYKLA